MKEKKKRAHTITFICFFAKGCFKKVKMTVKEGVKKVPLFIFGSYRLKKFSVIHSVISSKRSKKTFKGVVVYISRSRYVWESSAQL